MGILSGTTRKKLWQRWHCEAQQWVPSAFRKRGRKAARLLTTQLQTFRLTVGYRLHPPFAPPVASRRAEGMRMQRTRMLFGLDALGRDFANFFTTTLVGVQVCVSMSRRLCASTGPSVPRKRPLNFRRRSLGLQIRGSRGTAVLFARSGVVRRWRRRCRCTKQQGYDYMSC